MGEALDILNKALDESADNVLPFDKDDLDKLALAALAEEGLEPRIGDPKPLADLLMAIVPADDEETLDGSGMARFGRVIIEWGTSNFYTVHTFWSVAAAEMEFQEWRKDYYAEAEEV